MTVDTRSVPADCFIAERAGRERETCDPQRCVFFCGRGDGRCVCLLERLMPRDEWDRELAERWLAIRASLTALAD